MALCQRRSASPHPNSQEQLAVELKLWKHRLGRLIDSSESTLEPMARVCRNQAHNDFIPEIGRGI